PLPIQSSKVLDLQVLCLAEQVTVNISAAFVGAQIKTFGPFLRLAFQDGTVKSPAKVTAIMGFSQVNLIKCDVGTVVKYQFQSIFFDDFLHILKSLFHIQLMKHFVLYQDFFKNLMLTEEIKDVPFRQMMLLCVILDCLYR